MKTRYEPKYPEKYKGKYPILLKSSWEIEFAQRICDLNPTCVNWSYEPWEIPYRDPTSGRQTVYVPDFLVMFLTPAGAIKQMLVEIKPMHEALASHARSRGDAAVQAKNMAKWQAATQWCMRRGIEFKLITEAEMYDGSKLKPPSKRRIRPWKPKKVRKTRTRR